MRQLALCTCLAGSFISRCQSVPDETSSKTPITPTVKGARGNLQRLAGTWVGQRQDGFDLVKITLDSTGSYTRFTDRQQRAGVLPDSLRYSLYESPIRVVYQPDSPYQAEVAVLTSRFRFDYNLVADTLIEIDKMGVQGKLIRLRPEH